jgi:hypothetical protein
MNQKRLVSSVLVIGAILLGNCSSISVSLDQAFASISGSVSTAVGSISKSVSSVSRSSSKATDEAKARFEKDAEELVALSVQNPESIANLERNLDRLAKKDGVLDWRNLRGTYVALGAGFKKGNVSERELEEIITQGCPGKPELKEAIWEGYHKI